MRFVSLLRGMLLALTASVVVQAAQPDKERVALEIAKAEAAVKRAAEHKALWTSAEEALAFAKKRLADGNISGASASAVLAKDLAELSIAQTAYPLYSE
ncbi:MAG: hypothetical protein M3Q00_12475 [Pseudomonadota bacterium]|nr:hypothetical protein [Pseudomonadota bacterium]